MKKNNGIYLLISTVIFCFFGYYTVNNILFHLKEKENVIGVVVDDKGIADGVEKIYDAFVSVNVIKNKSNQGVGSGFIFSKDGYIITNHHVVEKNDSFGVFLGENFINAELIGSDEYYDIAVLKIKPEYVKSVAIIGNSIESRVGDTVFAIGTPVDLRYAGTVSRGIISAKNRKVETSVHSNEFDWLMDVIQIDAAINNGNSGGPLCNANGEVIGVNTMKVSNSNIESIAFAIPIETAIECANKIINNEEIIRPMLGIKMSNAYKSSFLSYYDIYLDNSIVTGVVVVEPLLDGPGYKAGLKKGDVIQYINDVGVNNIAELNYTLFKYKPGEKVNLGIIRNKKELTIEVELGKKEK